MVLKKRPTSVPNLPKALRVDVRRDEFNRMIDLLNERGNIINGLLKTQEIQFKRIAQLQADVDALTRQVERLNAKH